MAALSGRLQRAWLRKLKTGRGVDWMNWPKIELPASMKPVVTLVWHVAIGAILLSLILVIEVLLSGVIRLLTMIPFAPHWFLGAAEAVERGLFGFDMVVAVLFLATELIKLTKSFWKEIRNG